MTLRRGAGLRPAAAAPPRQHHKGARRRLRPCHLGAGLHSGLSSADPAARAPAAALPLPRPALSRLPEAPGPPPAASRADWGRGAFFASEVYSNARKGPSRGCEAGPVAFTLGGRVSHLDGPGMCPVAQRLVPRDNPSGARIYTAVTGHKPLRSGHNPPAAWLGRKGGKREKRKCSGWGGLHGGGGRHQDAPSRARALFLPAWTHVPGQKRRLGTNAPPVPQSQDLGRDIP